MSESIDLEHVKLMRLEPGDVIVLTMPKALAMTDDERVRIARALCERFPNHECVVLDDSMTLSVARSA